MGDYTKKLSRRIRGKTLGGLKHFLSAGDEFHAARFGRPSISVTHREELIPQEYPIVVEPHPDKYPNHQGSKGSVYGGMCNRTACNQTHAEWYNRGTNGYYCSDDAIAINRYSGKAPLCIVVDHDLTHEEMNVHTKAMYGEMRP